MKINEVSKITTLSQKTIRYYEERGLIHPDIKIIRERKFRDYSTKTIDCLIAIATLRKLFFSIEEIKVILEHPNQIDSLLLDYRNRLEEEIAQKNTLLTVLTDTIEHAEIINILSLSTALTAIAHNHTLPACDIHPDFSYMDLEQTEYNNQKSSRIYTKYSFFAKKANAMELFVLQLLWEQDSLIFSDIIRKGIEQKIFVDSDMGAKILKRMSKRKLVCCQGNVYTSLVNQSNIEFRNFDFMVQTAYNGSPNKMIYTPPSTSMGSGDGT